MRKLQAGKRSWAILAAALLGAEMFCTLTGFAQEPRLAARRKSNMPASQIADEAFKPLDQIHVVPRLDRALLPEDRAATLFAPPAEASPEAFRRADWHTSVYAWVPPEFFHRPLYFDDQPLERYGQTSYPRLQPAISTAKYFGDVIFMPYKIVVDGHHQWVSNLGYERPGTYMPPVRERLITPPHTYPRREVLDRPPLPGQ